MSAPVNWRRWRRCMVAAVPCGVLIAVGFTAEFVARFCDRAFWSIANWTDR